MSVKKSSLRQGIVMALILLLGYAAGVLAASGVEVDGDLTISGAGSLIFPDGTVQATAAAPSWHQILPGAERFVLVMNNNEAVLDNETGLVWEKSPSTSTSTWVDAVYHCATLYIGGRRGWHLPTIEQLASLSDTSVADSLKLPSDHPFVNVQIDCYWSATTLPDISSGAFKMCFDNNAVAVNPKSAYNYVWCARGGQSHDAY
jgi:hypothetical protein